MANVSPYRQSHLAHSLEARHRKPDPGKGERRRREATGATPAAIPPHPPLMAAGGGTPIQPVGGSVGAALVLAVLFGPAGLCYTSVTGGLMAIGVTGIALILFGFVALAVIWPLAIVAAVVSALIGDRRRE